MSTTTRPVPPSPDRARSSSGPVVTAVAVVLCALLAAFAVAVWPASAEDTAYDDGQRVGRSIADLREADTYAEVDDALTDVRESIREARDHAGDELSDQMTAQGDALSRALDGFAGATTTTDDWDQELYEAELEVALDDLSAQAGEFRTQAPEVEQAFYDGLEDGLDS